VARFCVVGSAVRADSVDCLRRLARAKAELKALVADMEEADALDR
jgi:hypothetical protein